MPGQFTGSEDVMDINIVTVTAEDIDALLRLVEQFATSFKPERNAFDASLQQLLQDDSAWLALAKDGNRVLGYLLGFDHYAFYANGRVAWVEEMMVEETMRRHGVGRRLMAAFEGWAVSRNAKLIGLATRRAASFYLALGYEESAVFFRKLL